MWNKNVLPSLPLLRTAAAFLLLLAFVRPVDAAQTPLSDSEARELIEEIEQGAAWAEDSLQKLKSDHLDREVLLDSLGYDPEAIILWVTENTLWVPYAGTLRGADGVLMDRRGNSLDRSQLLSALLEDAGVETRLVRAELPAETALRILAEQVSDPVRSIGPKLEAS